MRAEDPPEEWLVKAWDGDVLVDLIFAPKGLPIDDAVIARGDDMAVLSMQMRVMAIEDVLITKLMAINEHHCASRGCCRSPARCASRSTGTQVRAATAASPFARAFFVLLEGLEIVRARTADRKRRQRAARPGGHSRRFGVGGAG